MSADYTYPNRWKFELVHPKYKDFNLMIQEAELPGLNLGILLQPAMPRPIYRPGDNIDIDDLRLTFLVDEHLKSWYTLWQWIRDQTSLEDINLKQIFADATMFILDNKLKSKILVKFKNIFPYQLSTIQFSHNDEQHDVLTSSVTFKINDYTIELLPV